MATSSNQQYTDPQLRERLKEEIKQSDKGGAPGQWSARKAQFLAQEYKKQGGGYVGDKQQSQKHLDKWTKEEWQTKEGNAEARGKNTTKRYLPKKAWENMTEQEKQQTDAKKQQGSQQGKQFVSNTPKAKQAGAKARKQS